MKACHSTLRPAPPPPLSFDHLRAYAAWLTHGPVTERQLASRSDLTLIELHNLTKDILEVGGLEAVGMSEGEGPLYKVRVSDLNAPSSRDIVSRKLNTLPIRDQVSIAAGIMASHGKRGKAAAAVDRQQGELL
jgi:hypothetical protein